MPKAEKMDKQGTLRGARKKPKYIYSIISMILVLFLLGFFGMAILHAHQLVKVYKEKIDILVEIKPETTKNSILKVKRDLEVKKYIKKGSVRFLSKEEGVKLLQEEVGEDFMNMDFQNPLFDMLLFNVKEQYIHQDSLRKIRGQLMEHQEIRDVYFQDGMIGQIESNIRKAGIFAMIIAFLFIIITVTLIHNTIRLALYANRFLIKNMELVGASWEFISRPYLKRGLVNGLLSGLIAVGLLTLILLWVQKGLPELQTLQSLSSFGLLFGALLLLGIMISVLSTYYVVNKYLRMRTDDLY